MQVFRENLFDEESIKQMVSAVRLATLFHDCGRFQDFYNKSAENGHAQLSKWEFWILEIEVYFCGIVSEFSPELFLTLFKVQKYGSNITLRGFLTSLLVLFTG